MLVRLEYDGIVRNYACESMFDLIVLRDALERAYGHACVTAWNGASQL